ncbi:CHAT domain-containing protein, partial [Microcoleus sp.]
PATITVVPSAPIIQTPTPITVVPSAPIIQTPAPVTVEPIAPIIQTPAPVTVEPIAPIIQTPTPVTVVPSTPIIQTPTPVTVVPSTPIIQTPTPVNVGPIAPTIQTPAPITVVPIAPTIQTPALTVATVSPPAVSVNGIPVVPAVAPINLDTIPKPTLPPTLPVNPLPIANPVFSPNSQQLYQISNSLQQPNLPSATNINTSNWQRNLDAVIFPIEERLTRDFVNYLNLPSTNAIATLEDAQKKLSAIEKATGIKPALIYITFLPKGNTIVDRSYSGSSILRVEQQIQNSEELELILVTASGEPIRRRIPLTSRTEVLALVQKFRNEVTNPVKRNTKSYLPVAQQLYQMMIAPLDAELQARGINNLSFISDMGLRSVPMAALHDGKGFLIERYSVGSMPSLSLTDTSTSNFKNTQLLAMGASQFADMSPLPAVEIEVSTIARQEWPGKSFLNQAFTLANLKSQRQQQPFGMIHLATHAEFRSGDPSNSFIQLWDTKLRLDQLRQMNWHSPQVELLVLSACRTAVGDRDAELGFGGLAVQAGVKSALATLWYVSDEGSLGLMSEFYSQLKNAPIKAEALRQAQLAMLRQTVRIEGGVLHTSSGSLPLPHSIPNTGSGNFSHPYYWSAFRMIGNPW